MNNNFIVTTSYSQLTKYNKYETWDLSQTNKIMYSHSHSSANRTKTTENNSKQEILYKLHKYNNSNKLKPLERK